MSICAILLNYRGAGKRSKRLAADTNHLILNFSCNIEDTFLYRKPAKNKQKFRLAMNAHVPQRILLNHE